MTGMCEIMFVCLKGLEASVYMYPQNASDGCIYVKMDVSFTVKYHCVHSSTDKSVQVK